jgi:hypothetical protein
MLDLRFVRGSSEKKIEVFSKLACEKGNAKAVAATEGSTILQCIEGVVDDKSIHYDRRFAFETIPVGW